jgi:NitT/TauT family transport system ATP-binding protein
MTKLRIGYIPLIDAAIPIAAHECGFAEAQGLKLELVREVSWANIRDKLILDLLDASHMLAPLAVATSLGIGHIKVPVIAPFALNANGNCITLAASLYRELEDVLGHIPLNALEAARALGTVLRRRKKQNAMLTFAVVYPFSLHAFLIRHWLRAGGIDPERDVQFVVIPPPYMGASLSNGLIQGYCVGEPWNSRAVEDGTGCIAAFGSEINRFAPDKVLVLPEKKLSEPFEATAKLLRAYHAAAKWCEDANNRSNLANILAQPQYLNVAPRTIFRALSGNLAVTRTETRHTPEFIRFCAEGLNRPHPRKGRWIYAETMHMLSQPIREEDARAAANVFRPDLFDAAMGQSESVMEEDPIGLAFGPPFKSDDLNAYIAAL